MGTAPPADDVVTITTDVDEPTIPLPDLALQVAALKLFAEQAATVYKQADSTLRDRLLDRYRAEGFPSLHITTPDRVKVAQATVSVPKDAATVTDEAAFAEWVSEVMPNEVEIKVVVRESTRKAILGAVTFDEAPNPDDPDGPPVMQAIWTKTGEVVPGVILRPGGDPSSHSIRFETPAKTGAKTATNQMPGRQRLARHILEHLPEAEQRMSVRAVIGAAAEGQE